MGKIEQNTVALMTNMEQSMISTPIEDVTGLHRELRQRTSQDPFIPVKKRKQQLKALNSWIWEHRELMIEALAEDFKKPAIESMLTEVYVLRSSIKHTLKHLNDWTSIQKVHTPLALFGNSGCTQAQSKGLVLIIAPWNFPFLLAIKPLISAIAAGNRIVLKPSEHAPNSSSLMCRMVSECFDRNIVQVIQGGVAQSQKLLELKWDHIFFTGGTEIGRIVMKAAANTLTPVTLELGGKNPSIVDSESNLKNAARRIIWGKFLNGSQACVASDYILVDQKVAVKFKELLKEELARMYDSKETPMACAIHQKQFDKVVSILDDAVAKGAKVLKGGSHNKSALYVQPTILEGVTRDMTILQEEVFGPLLPIIAYENLEEALDFVHQGERPLSLYVFTNSTRTKRAVLENSWSGTLGINTTTIQFNHPSLPFGGTGES